MICDDCIYGTPGPCPILANPRHFRQYVSVDRQSSCRYFVKKGKTEKTVMVRDNEVSGFISVDELVRDTDCAVERLFGLGAVDALIAVADAGLVVACLVRMKAGRPIPILATDTIDFWPVTKGAADTLTILDEKVKTGEDIRLLIVDDAVATGRTAGRAIAAVHSRWPTAVCEIFATYVDRHHHSHDPRRTHAAMTVKGVIETTRPLIWQSDHGQCQTCRHRSGLHCNKIRHRRERRRLVRSPSGCPFYEWMTPGTSLLGTYPAVKFIRTRELVADAVKAVQQLDICRYGAVAGIARSGLIPAAAIATHFHIPLYSVDIHSGSMIHTGFGYRLGKIGPVEQPPDREQYLLLVDDTVCAGATFRLALDVVREAIHGMGLAGVETLALYGPRDVRSLVDHLGYFYERPHFLEWCFGNTMLTESMAFDMDGLICDDPPGPDTSPQYQDHLANARPRHLPRKWPTVIVTARCEKYRPETMDWLKRHRVACRELVMWPGDPDARWATPDTVAYWKADILTQLRRTGHIHFYAESDPRQAAIIAEAAKMPVICPAAGRVFNIDTDGTDGHWS